MKLFNLTIFILLPLFLFGQTKSETEEWILTKFNLYQLKSWAHKDDKLILQGDAITLIELNNFYSRIRYKDISEIQVKKYHVENREGYTIDFFCTQKLKCIEEGKFEAGTYNPRRGNLNYFMNIYLDKSFEENDLPKRMEKALLHLIKLNGGSAKIYEEKF